MRFNLMDNVITRALSKICDMICLNVLWVICSIPIVTIGASTTALYTVMLKMVRNEEGYIFRGFFKAFKENFKQSTIIWLIVAALGAVWWIDYRVSGLMGQGISDAFRIIFLLLGFLLLSVIIYVFPLTARYENSISATFKNAIILTVAKLPYTFIMVAVLVIAVLASLWNTMMLMMALPLWFIFGVSLIAWVNSYLLRRVFTVFEQEEEDTKEKEEV
mgnify:FL=1